MKGWRSWDLGRSGTSAPERPAKWDLPRAPGAIAHGHTPPKPVPPCENKIRGGSRQVPGEIVLDGHGFSFAPRRATAALPLDIAWAEMTHIQLLPISAAPVAGSLVLSLRGGRELFPNL